MFSSSSYGKQIIYFKFDILKRQQSKKWNILNIEVINYSSNIWKRYFRQNGTWFSEMDYNFRRRYVLLLMKDRDSSIILTSLQPMKNAEYTKPYNNEWRASPLWWIKKAFKLLLLSVNLIVSILLKLIFLIQYNISDI